MSTFDENFRKALAAAGANDRSIPVGDCFRFAYNRVRELGNGAVLVHANVTHPWDKSVFSHAWVEHKQRVIDWQSEVVRKTKPIPIAKFYETWNPKSVRRYSADEALAEMLKAKHLGPW